MTIYLDIVLLENLCMNFIILFATGYILRIKCNIPRIFLASFLGGLYVVISYIDITKIYSNIITKIVLSILMIYISFNSKNIKSLIKQLLLFYMISFLFGGCAFSLLYVIKPEEILIRNGVLIGTYSIKVAFLGAIVGFTLCVITFKVVKRKLEKTDMIYEIEIYLDSKKIKINAFIDTGNSLKDPITKLPVIVVEKECLAKIVPLDTLNYMEKLLGGDTERINLEIDEKYISKFRIIPFKSIGIENGMLIGFKPDKVLIKNEEIEEIKNTIIGIYNRKLSKKNNYNALLSLDVFERRIENEFVKKVS